MTAIAKAIAMAKPKHLDDCVATVAIDAVASNTDDPDIDKKLWDYEVATEEIECADAYSALEKSQEKLPRMKHADKLSQMTDGLTFKPINSSLDSVSGYSRSSSFFDLSSNSIF